MLHCPLASAVMCMYTVDFISSGTNQSIATLEILFHNIKWVEVLGSMELITSCMYWVIFRNFRLVRTYLHYTLRIVPLYDSEKVLAVQKFGAALHF